MCCADCRRRDVTCFPANRRTSRPGFFARPGRGRFAKRTSSATADTGPCSGDENPAQGARRLAGRTGRAGARASGSPGSLERLDRDARIMFRQRTKRARRRLFLFLLALRLTRRKEKRALHEKCKGRCFSPCLATRWRQAAPKNQAAESSVPNILKPFGKRGSEWDDSNTRPPPPEGINHPPA